MKLITLPGVFQPRSDTWLLAEVLGAERLPADAAVLDLGTGSGALAVTAALYGAQVTAVDVSRRALLTARINARRHGVRVRARRGDLFAAVGRARFDAIVSNPPYVPSPDDRVRPRGRARAWDAGRLGRDVIDRICAGAADHLRPGGVLLLVHSSLVGAQETLRVLAAAGLHARIAARRPGSLGPLMAARAAMLRERGLLGPGAREEELVVIRARAEPRPASPVDGSRGAPVGQGADSFARQGARTLVRPADGFAIQPAWRRPTLLVASR